MSRFRLDDRAPGAKIETFCLPEGRRLFIMRIASAAPHAAPRLFVRCDANGEMFAAMAPAGALASGSDE